MGTPRDPRIDAFIAEKAEFARPILKHLRELVHKACPDVTETIKWGMPNFEYGGGILCGMAAFKAHCSFGFWHQEMEALLKKEGVYEGEVAMGSLGRITSLADLPSDKALLRYIKTAAELNLSGKPARPRPKGPAKVLPTPPDLEAALKKNKLAAKTFAEFAPSHRKEYIEWITEAKREETRQKRIATTLEWLAEGKSRNWKYENC